MATPTATAGSASASPESVSRSAIVLEMGASRPRTGSVTTGRLVRQVAVDREENAGLLQ